MLIKSSDIKSAQYVGFSKSHVLRYESYGRLNWIRIIEGNVSKKWWHYKQRNEKQW